MLLDLAFISKTHKPLIDQGTQTNKDEFTPSIIETTGNKNVKLIWLNESNCNTNKTRKDKEVHISEWNI